MFLHFYKIKKTKRMEKFVFGEEGNREIFLLFRERKTYFKN